MEHLTEQLRRIEAKFHNLGAAKQRGVSARGTVHPHLHHPCPKCGYATRFKQWPISCLCTEAPAAPRAHLTNPDHLIPAPSSGQDS